MIRTEQITGEQGTEMRATLDRPLDHLSACHRRIEERLAGLERAAYHLDDRREEAIKVIENCFRFLDSNGIWHTADEEESVFPRLVRRISEEDRRLIQDLEAEHRDAEALMGDLKTLHRLLAASGGNQEETTRLFRQGVATLCAAYRNHIAAEDGRLIPLAMRILGDLELAALSREMRSRRGLAAKAGLEL